MKTKFLRKVAVCAALAAGVSSAAHAVTIGVHMGSDGKITQYNDFGNWLG